MAKDPCFPLIIVVWVVYVRGIVLGVPHDPNLDWLIIKVYRAMSQSIHIR